MKKNKIKLIGDIFVSIVLLVSGIAIILYRDLNNIGWEGGLNFSPLTLIALLCFILFPVYLAISIADYFSAFSEESEQ